MPAFVSSKCLSVQLLTPFPPRRRRNNPANIRMQEKRRLARHHWHKASLMEEELLLDKAVIPDAPPPPPPATPPPPELPSLPPLPAANRAVRCRLPIGVQQSAESSPQPAALERSTNPTSPAPPSPDVVRRLSESMSGCSSDDVSNAPSRSASPGVYCSQFRLQTYEDAIRNSRYPTPPEAPPKDQYIPESESEGSSQSQQWQSPAKIFRNGQLQFHKTYKGPVPLTYVDTGVYEGGSNDYYEVYTRVDLDWARRLNLVLKHHGIVRCADIK